MKTLYVSDLDGTLLRRDKTVSAFTVETINELTSRGMLFSYATARSYITASRLTAGITAHIPVIIYNGAFILENGTGRQLHSEHLSAEDARRVLDILLAHGIYPIVYAMIDGVEKYTHCPALESQAAKTFEDGRPGDVRANPTDDPADLYRGDIFNITCIDDSECGVKQGKLATDIIKHQLSPSEESFSSFLFFSYQSTATFIAQPVCVSIVSPTSQNTS